MASRIEELQRQRRLVQEHLAWLDAEIARASGLGGQPAPSTPRLDEPPQPFTLAPSAAKPVDPVGEAAAEEILTQYRDDALHTERDVKRGCYIVFFSALALFLAFVAFTIFVYPSLRNGAPAPVEAPAVK